MKNLKAENHMGGAKMKRTVSTFIIIVAFFSAFTTGSFAREITHPIISIDQMNRRDEKRFQQEQADREEMKADKEASKRTAEERSRDRDETQARASGKLVYSGVPCKFAFGGKKISYSGCPCKWMR
jgi:hypothetical protein